MSSAAGARTVLGNMTNRGPDTALLRPAIKTSVTGGQSFIINNIIIININFNINISITIILKFKSFCYFLFFVDFFSSDRILGPILILIN